MHDESARIAALKNLRLLDTMPSENFDRITRLVANYFGLPIAAISLTDVNRQWFKSKVGVEHNEIPRVKAPCAEVAETCAPVVIRDFAADPYYADSTLGNAGIRFYCGVPLLTPKGYGLGALCVLGTEPFEVSDEQVATLSDLAAMVMDQIELQQSLGRIEPSSGLPNRYQLLSDLGDMCTNCNGQSRIISLLDLAQTSQFDRMLRVVGMSHVDGMVEKVARILKQHLGDEAHAYHVAPTQFAFLAPEAVSTGEHEAFLNAIIVSLSAELEFQIAATPSIGFMQFVPGKTEVVEEILRALQSAVQDARDSDKKIAYFSSETDVRHQRNFVIQRDFPRALEDEEQLSLVFQPRIDAMNGGYKSAEVLLRWNHPTLGNVSPGEFIPVIEASAFARPLTQWVVMAALRQLATWNAGGLRIKLSINLSAINLQEGDFIERLNTMLAQYGVACDQIEFELTETAMMLDTTSALDLLNQMTASGIRFSIDDFGTGYSSLAYLQKLPADVVKIDRSFISDLKEGHRERVLVQSMIALSHSLGYEVVAEGVETREEADLLATMGCDELQGYWVSRPLDSNAFLEWLSERNGAVLAYHEKIYA
ncbi:EAL domain-containing protein [Agrobacterium sp. SORGH_AS 787]|uniref:bifunctional diguanylate cyclase/phosphodiesterase n=1 Tax=Agrobacterium sp. SORGH_AS 787 TaxID=3041775 RepID=UPI00277DACC5|nr:EAL domain-containing protein (putative c-di-GMP-specific phosphodiesterase class I)/GGDEF domain-containing protein [Rhizobium sp. SORGH_AS_0787]